MQWSQLKNLDIIVKLHLEAIFADTIVRSSKDHETGNAVEKCVGTVVPVFNKR